MINQRDMHAIGINVTWNHADGTLRSALMAQPCVGYISRQATEAQVERFVNAIRATPGFVSLHSVEWTFNDVYGDAVYGNGQQYDVKSGAIV